MQKICRERNHDSEAKCPKEDDSCTKNALSEIFPPDVLFGSCRQDTAVRSFNFGPHFCGHKSTNPSQNYEQVLVDGVTGLVSGYPTIQLDWGTPTCAIGERGLSPSADHAAKSNSPKSSLHKSQTG